MIISLIILCLFCLITAINIICGPYLRRAKQPNRFPLVSVLVPARNEELNIGRCLDSLLNQDYPNLEILALNDNSSDNTGQIIAQYETNHSQVSGYEGESLPADWLGKNWACWQTAT